MPIDMKAFARAGAEARLKQLLAEVAEIRQSFPELGGARSADRSLRPRAVTTEQPKRRARKPMTGAQRRAVAQRMKKYWAGRRKEQSAKEKA
jgi:hypothetical protein